MDIETLLKPRYKVIGDYPGSAFKIGEIITGHTRYGFGIFPYCHKYPALFKKLDWWQERDKKDMPLYIKWTNPGTKEVSFFEVFQWLSNSAGVYVADIREYHLFIKDIEPATREEYEDYIRSQPHQPKIQ